MLLKKMLRDMGRHKTQFISIFLMAFLAMFIYTGVGAEWHGLQQSADDYYAETNLADAWLYGSGFTEEQTQAVESLPGVTAVERRLETSAVVSLENTPTLSLYFVEKNEISQLFLTEGAEFNGNDADGIWVAGRFAGAHHLKIGDPLEMTLNGMTLSKTIRGLIYSSEQVFMSTSDTLTPDFGLYGYAYLSPQALPAPEMLTYNTLLLKAESTAGLEDRISTALDGKYGVFLEQKDHPSVSMFRNETTQHKMMSDIFPIVFLLIAVLTMMTTMTRIVTNQRMQIGTLKALGFKKSTVLRHYVSYGFFLALAGVICGLATGPIAVPKLFYPSMSAFYTMPAWKPAYHGSFLWMSAVIVGLCTLVTWLSCGKLLRDTPADTLRPRAPRLISHGFWEYGRLWERLGFNTQWNIRDASRNRVRSLMAVVGVFGCTALIVCALGLNDSTTDLKAWQYETVNRYESKLILDEAATPVQAETIKEAVNGEAIMEIGVEIRAGDTKKTGELLVTDNTTLIRPTDIHMNPVDLPAEGISLTAKMAEMLNIRQGDSIEWRVYGSESWNSSEVAAIYREPVSQGITMSRALLEAQGLEFRPTAILSSEKVSGDFAGDDFAGVDSVQSTADSIAGWDALTEAMYTMVYLLIAMAGILSVVVLYNLGLLSFTEMEREMATLKVMGMKTARLRRLLLTQNLWFSAVGFVLGVPGGIKLIEIIVSFSGESFDFPVGLHLRTLLVSLAFTFGLSVLVNLMFSRKIRRLNMVESLKAME